MDFSFTEEQQAIQELSKQIFENRADPESIKKVEASEDGVDRELWSELAQANLLGLALAEEYGGSGFDELDLCLLFEEQGRHLNPVPLYATLALGAPAIARFGSEVQRKELLSAVASGSCMLSAALSELGSSDSALPRCTARRDGEGFLLDAEKCAVPAANVATRVLIPARCEDGVAVFLLDPTSKGVVLEREESVHRQPSFGMRLAAARVPAEAQLGKTAEGAEVIRFIETRALLALSAIQLGVAEEALRRTADYTTTRKQFGKPIGSFQGVSMRAADGYIAVEAMRSTLWQAAWRVAQGRPAAREVAVAKWWACRGGHDVVHSAQHLHAGIGADIDYPIHRYFLWSTWIENCLGGATRQLARLGSMLARGEGSSV